MGRGTDYNAERWDRRFGEGTEISQVEGGSIFVGMIGEKGNASS